MNTYTTSEIADLIGIHPNTVRLYEELELIPKPKRNPNGYRIFNDFHIEQFKFARTALKIEVTQRGLRKNAIEIVRTSANKDFDKAISLVSHYLQQLEIEKSNAEEAINIVKEILNGNTQETDKLFLTRKETSEYLKVTIDTLRNWEMNGLLKVKRKQNGYRVYTDEDIKRLKIINSLRSANYSLSAILRMLNALSCNPNANIKTVIDTPKDDDEIISVCDKLITSLKEAEYNAKTMKSHLQSMKEQFS
ncbi:MerR family transcriptional regulator [Clostridioides sp. ES-S-0123-01]|uniref:MerR family transcriptional regulator n=1 Tax=unclassified Clostridioides TaxID=2635829 RepID=UPI001D0C14D7|nr:MerR family transcriptional regulator [Clostridioides sp. ES-S-0123-01]MCC0694541.1 MerR family transcriptional regulator [Clostridioides sp. ES-S-0048-02]MCC0702717.1 MerR family transcriptional regulator [Clostridioides sp. ES-S-0049-02]MCC0762686.1 MerR family transcriptional regulator [Clostridioides sp. ES-S-0006-03]